MPDGGRTTKRTTAWLSSGLETLVAKLKNDDNHFDFDVVIVGSGYGGSIAAAELSKCTDGANPLRVCVLERGKEYLAGSYPSRQAELPGHVRFFRPNDTEVGGVSDGLFDLRTSEDAVTLVASGVGGGSLVNAGVMEMPHDSVFQDARWPAAIRSDKTLATSSALLRRMLGAAKLTDRLAKTQALEALAGSKHSFSLAHITVANADGPNDAGVELNACSFCGDCATGCNYNAKDSLDLNLLRRARESGAELYSGAAVLRVLPHASGKGWIVEVSHTNKQLRAREAAPFEIRTRRVVLAAGTLGSTEILMRSRGKKMRLSDQLGRKFSANGDMIVVGYDTHSRVNAVARETDDPSNRKRGIGPTITGMIDMRTGNPDTDVVIQDLAVPGPLRRMFEEGTTTADLINRIAVPDLTKHVYDPAHPDEAAVDPRAIENAQVLAMIARDDADGELQGNVEEVADGVLTVKWPGLKLDSRLAEHHRTLDKMLQDSGVGGRVVANMIWRPFTDKLEDVFGKQRGPLVTVHPLGGCAMGEDISHGVVDDCGRVFDGGAASPTATYDGLVVLDGSIIPTSLGINPALTISVLTLRAITALKKLWGVSETRGCAPPKIKRPIFAVPATRANPKPTRVELTEQMRGRLHLVAADGSVEQHVVELTLTTSPVEIADLMRQVAPGGRRLPVAEGRLRILKAGKTFDAVSDEICEPAGKNAPSEVELIAEVTGHLQILARGPSKLIPRTARALWAWFRNRGFRDGCQRAIEGLLVKLNLAPPADKPPFTFSNFLKFLLDITRLCTRAGTVRLIEYDLRVGKLIYQNPRSAFPLGAFEGGPIAGAKRLTYARAGSPYDQLLTLPLEEFPFVARWWRPKMWWMPGRSTTLKLNERYLARQAVPLMRVVQQEDRVAALSDLASFALYSLRLLLQSHALSFRKPDPPARRTAERLPGVVEGLPLPQIDWLSLGTRAKQAVRIRLARYDGRKGSRRDGTPDRPVLLIHGYSASGTTYVHSAVRGNLVEKLCAAGRDAWVLDMRTSPGLPTATGDWAFETMAKKDIPAAIGHVLRVTGAEKVDIVAHCMGAAMFSMSMLRGGRSHEALSRKIGRAVFSQVGPVMLMSSANILRAYIMRYAREFLRLEGYTFSPQGDPSIEGQLLDRALAALPMPLDEYKRENPMWPPKATPWAGTRHRMDALYARTFSLMNIPESVLDSFDDFFGPLSIETVSQVIHFAGFKTVTDRDGINRYVVPTRIKNRFTFPILSIHGEDNGLVDIATLSLMRDTLGGAGIRHLNEDRSTKGDPTERAQSAAQIRKLIAHTAKENVTGKASFMSWRIAGHGHQDCLIGQDAGTICGVITEYLGLP